MNMNFLNMIFLNKNTLFFFMFSFTELALLRIETFFYDFSNKRLLRRGFAYKKGGA